MGFFDRLFNRKPRKKPEEYYTLTISEETVKVEHPKRKPEQVKWKDIVEIAVVTSDEGPFLPDHWLVLIGEESGCTIPLGTPDYDKVFDIISKYEGFNFEEYNLSTTSTSNARFELWKK